MAPTLDIAAQIDQSPYNRGVSGADWLSNPENIALVFENGDLALFENERDGSYEGHFMFVSRGKEAIANGKEALRVMFEEHGATLLFGLTPDHLKHAKLASRWIGFKSAGIRKTDHGDCELFVLSDTMWKGN